MSMLWLAFTHWSGVDPANYRRDDARAVGRGSAARGAPLSGLTRSLRALFRCLSWSVRAVLLRCTVL